MIIALEGPCFAGKSTLFVHLKEYASKLEGLRRHLHWLKFQKADVYGMRVPHYTYESLLIQLFSMMYDPDDDLIIADRIWTVTSVVYNRVRNDPISQDILQPDWLADLRVIYLPSSPGLIGEDVEYPIRLKELEQCGTQVFELPMMPVEKRARCAFEQIVKWCD